MNTESEGPKIVHDDSIPPGTVEFRNEAGETVGRIENLAVAESEAVDSGALGEDK